MPQKIPFGAARRQRLNASVLEMKNYRSASWIEKMQKGDLVITLNSSRLRTGPTFHKAILIKGRSNYAGFQKKGFSQIGKSFASFLPLSHKQNWFLEKFTSNAQEGTSILPRIWKWTISTLWLFDIIWVQREGISIYWSNAYIGFWDSMSRVSLSGLVQHFKVY